MRAAASAAPPADERLPVWRELAALYLDTEHDDAGLRYIAGVLAASPYSVAELREIELWEVAPVVWSNLIVPAGAWQGFDQRWLAAACARQAGRRSVALRLAVPLGFRRFVRWATNDYWQRLGPMIQRARRESPPATPT
jgi:hypothetical protein